MIKVASIFAQVLSLINRREFSRSVAELEAEKGAKGFRCWEQLACMLLCHLAAKQKRRFRFKNPMVSIDSTTIDLCLSMFDWARFRRAKGAIKQNLKIKTFVGTSENAVKIQIWTAEIR